MGRELAADARHSVRQPGAQEEVAFAAPNAVNAAEDVGLLAAQLEHEGLQDSADEVESNDDQNF